MPFVAVHIAQGRPLEKRRRLAAAITDAVAEILELERREIQVLIHEHERDNWAVAGELLSERQVSQSDDLPDLDALFKKPAARAEPKPVATPAPKSAARKPAAKSRPRR